MRALFRLLTQTVRLILAIVAMVAALALFGMAWTYWGDANSTAAAFATIVGLMLVLIAIRIRPRRLADPPTRKQLAFAKRLGIDAAGLDKWALSDAIDEALDERDLDRKLRG